MNSKLKLKEKIGYALGDTAANFAWRPLVSFLPFFYTDVVGLPLVAVSTLLMITRLSDGITDVIMGTVADRTETKWGKFRPWVLWTAIPFGLFLVLTFTNPKFGNTGNLIWAYFTYIILTLIYTANNVPYSALMGVITSDIQERTSVSAFRFFGAFAGGALVLGLTNPLVKFLGGDNESLGYQYTYYIFAAVLAALSIITFLSTKERVKPSKTQKTSIVEDFKDLSNNKPWIILLIVGFLFVAYNSLKQGVTIYYFTHFVGNKILGGTYLSSLVIISMGASLLAPFFTRLIGKRELFILAILFSGLVNTLLYFAQPDNLVYIFIIGNISEIGAAILPVLFFSMLGDAADYSEWKNNRRATGLVFSAGTFAMKFGGGIAGGLMLLIMKFYGYIESSGEAKESFTQSARAIQGIKLNMSIVPLIFVVISVLLLIFYPLGKARMQEIEENLKNRRLDRQNKK